MRSPYIIYFAGVGTVVAALAVGFGGGLALTTTSALKEDLAVTVARQERLKIIGKSEVSRIDAAKADASPGVASVAVTAPAPAEAASSGTLTTITMQAPLAVPPTAMAQNVTAVAPVPALATQQSVAAEAVSQKSEAAEKRKTDRNRKQVAERKARDNYGRDNSYRREWSSGDDIADPTRAGTRTMIVRTYETRSRGLAGLFGSGDDD
ncbi:MAG: hypothetical protein NTZ72_19890 [Afipia sp.]|nr:hypothetical protein [Afipia sp.]